MDISSFVEHFSMDELTLLLKTKSKPSAAGFDMGTYEMSSNLDQFRPFYLEDLNAYSGEGYAIYATDASITHTTTGMAVYNVSSENTALSVLSQNSSWNPLPSHLSLRLCNQGQWHKICPTVSSSSSSSHNLQKSCVLPTPLPNPILIAFWLLLDLTLAIVS
ncbi:hypothetical protein FF38_02580 [Lucilia cuprina]|uniref:Uncharacterized protein n=1 Tax=Lucilia cuprina TaxID=7375 RepID=A0A0L0CBI0_LUCCU|nr:hypothetical protein FF38_02580 [Lucilia cuprina]